VSTLNSSKILIVDVDGTLCPVDTLKILRMRWRLRKPFAIFAPAQWRKNSKQTEKLMLWKYVGFGGSPVCYAPVVEKMATWISRGGQVIVVTGSATGLGQWITSGLREIPTEVHGSDISVNLTKESKARFIKENFDVRSTTYIGDSLDDIHTWKIVDGAIVILNSKTKKIDFSTLQQNVEFIPQLSLFGRVKIFINLLLQPLAA